MLKKASEMSVEELRAEVEKIEAQRAKRRAYTKEKRKALTPEQRTKRLAYAKTYRVRQQEVLARAAGLGAAGSKQPEPPAKPQEAKPIKKR